jgi:hypothetical protein
MTRFHLSTDRGRRTAAVAIAMLAVSGIVHGCTSPTAPPSPPGGGQKLNLSFNVFQTTIDPILGRHGCDAGGDCHGGGIRGTLELSPESAKDVRFDFDQVALQVWPSAPDSSPILTRPLALDAGGTPHPFKPFAATSDSDYQAIRQWVLAGVQP